MFTRVSYFVALAGMGAINLIFAQQTSGQFQVQSPSGNPMGYLREIDSMYYLTTSLTYTTTFTIYASSEPCSPNGFRVSSPSGKNLQYMIAVDDAGAIDTQNIWTVVGWGGKNLPSGGWFALDCQGYLVTGKGAVFGLRVSSGNFLIAGNPAVINGSYTGMKLGDIIKLLFVPNPGMTSGTSGEVGPFIGGPLSADIGSTMGDPDADAVRSQAQIDIVTTTTQPASSSSASPSSSSSSSAPSSFAPSRLLIIWFSVLIWSLCFIQ